MATFPIAHRSTRNVGLLPKTIRHSNPSTTTPAHIHWYVDASDHLTLRGIPAIGFGVAGVIAGTRPDQIANRDT